MFKRALFCAISASALVPAPASAGHYYRDYASGPYTHHWSWHESQWRPVRASSWRFYHRPRYRYGYHWRHYAMAAYRPGVSFLPGPDDATLAPILASTGATALVPVVTYAPVAVRTYYIPQQQPYYNVPPYTVRVPYFCN